MTSRIFWIDWVRVLAAFAVVLLHVSAQIMVDPGPIAPHSWLVASFYNSLTRWAVPGFAVLSGFLVFRESTTYDRSAWLIFWRRRLGQLSLPLLFWTIVYLVLWHPTPPQLTLTAHWWHLIMFDQPFEHLYFIWVLMALYLMSPILVMVIEKLGSWKSLFVLAVFFLSFAWPEKRFLPLIWIPWTGYYLLGGALTYLKTPSRQLTWPLVFGCGWLLACLGTWAIVADHTLVRQLTHNLAWFGFFHPNTVIQTILILGFSATLPFFRRPIPLARHTLGIYLIHPLLVKIVSPWLIRHSTWALFAIPITAGLVFSLSYLAAWGYGKIYSTLQLWIKSRVPKLKINKA